MEEKCEKNVNVSGSFWKGFYIHRKMFSVSKWKKMFMIAKNCCVEWDNGVDKSFWMGVELFTLKQHYYAILDRWVSAYGFVNLNSKCKMLIKTKYKKMVKQVKIIY